MSLTSGNSGKRVGSLFGAWLRAGMARGTMLAGLAVALLSGCQTSAPMALPSGSGAAPEAQTLREGDQLRIGFPGAPTLDAQQTIQRDGTISLSMVGQIRAAGLTLDELKAELIKRYSTQLVSKEVSVSIVSSTFKIYVIGAVLKPGPVVADHQLDALEAVMAAGGFDTAKANPKKVVIIRTESGKRTIYGVDLQKILDGKSSETYMLKPDDILTVPEKISWL